MADIREILKALSPDDRAMWSQHRTEMRRSYLLAHNETIGMEKWTYEDDSFMDLIDIRLALLYDRSGRLVTNKELIGDDGDKIAEKLNEADAARVKPVEVAKPAEAPNPPQINGAIQNNDNQSATDRLRSGAGWRAH